jgi:hypothetical protein
MKKPPGSTDFASVVNESKTQQEAKAHAPMATKRDTKTPRRVKAEFDEGDFSTSHGGAVLVEQAMRRLGIRKVFEEALPARGGVYTSKEVCLQFVAGQLCGGKGFQATEPFLKDSELARIFGLGQVASPATLYRTMCDLSGLEQRRFGDVYTEAGASVAALDVFGDPVRRPAHRRTVSEEPEAMSEELAAQWDEVLARVAKRAGRLLKRGQLALRGFLPVFGDGTDIEVEGRCFDAARKNRHGERCLRAMTVMVGPLVAALSVLPGDADEGHALPGVLERAARLAGELAGKLPVLALLDAAFAEKQVIEWLCAAGWKFLVCANQYSGALERIAAGQPRGQWKETGPDERRGWTESAVLTMSHWPEGWPGAVTVAVRRWKNAGEIVYRYSFLYTNLEAEHLPAALVKKHGLAQSLWMLYGTKQGRENNFKTLLSDMNLHRPASGRLGLVQALGYLAAVAANIHAFLAYRVVPKQDEGIRHWRFLRDYVLIAGRVAMQAGRCLLVRLAGGGLCAGRKRRFLLAQAVLTGT